MVLMEILSEDMQIPHVVGVWLRLPWAPAARICGPRRPEPLAPPHGLPARVLPSDFARCSDRLLSGSLTYHQVLRFADWPVRRATANFGLALPWGRARALGANPRLTRRRPRGVPAVGVSGCLSPCQNPN